MAAAANVDGQEKVIATAQQIVKSLATSKNAAEDMIRILSGFDNRLSSITDLFPSANPSFDEPDPFYLESRLASAEKVILHWDSCKPDSLLFKSSPDDAADYLSAVDEILSVADDSDFTDELRGRAESILQIAMSQLEEEFRHLMIQNTVPLDPKSLHSSIRRPCFSFASDSGETLEDFEALAEDEQQQRETSLEERGGSSLSDDRYATDLIRPEAIADLKDIADRMMWSGYGKELCQVYSSVRREILDECLMVLGFDRLSIDDVQRMEWRNLDEKMKKWSQIVKTMVRVLLLGERQLCDQIFTASDELKEECFAESTKGCVLQLLNFGDAIAIGRRASEKLFRILDMYEALNDVIPDLKELFSDDLKEFICGEANKILNGLGCAVKGTLTEFGNQVQKETSRKPLQAGEIHPLTRYVMNYVRLLVDYSSSFDSLVENYEKEEKEKKEKEEKEKKGEEEKEKKEGHGDCPEDSESKAQLVRHPEDSESMTPLGHQLWLWLSYLESNIEEKSKLYEDAAMKYIFLMNNRHYIVQKVKDSELRTLLGDQWVRKRRGQIRQYATSYLRASWTKALSHLKDDGLGGSGSANSVSRVALKERFKNFNLAFEEIYRTQTAWKVPDPQLREELRLSISEKVLPAYRSFMGRFGGQLEAGRHATKYIKYTPEDLESHLLDLFEGLPGLSNHPRRKLSS